MGESINLLKQQERELIEFDIKMRKYIIDRINEGLTNNSMYIN